MPNTKAAIRRVSMSKETQVNRIRKSKYKTAVKRMDIKRKDKEKAKKYYSKILNSNAGCQVSIISKNTASRKFQNFKNI